jgi:arylsulfatase A-like enzyme
VANRLTPAYGHHRGFDRFIYHFPEAGFTQRRYDPAAWLSDLTGHLDAHRRDRTFSYVHLPDVHPVWEIPPFTRSFNLARRGDSVGLDLRALRKAANADEQGRQLYLLRLHDLDRLLGGAFDFIDRNLADETIVLLTADHGTPWHHLRERRPADEPNLVDDRTAISLRMRGPGVPRRRYNGLIAPNIDLLPTLFALAGFETPPDLDGENVLAPRRHRDVVLAESLYGGVYEVAARDGARVYIEKYPFHETDLRLTGAATYAKLFDAGTPDYSRSLADDPGILKAAVRAHLAHCSLEEARA